MGAQPENGDPPASEAEIDSAKLALESSLGPLISDVLGGLMERVLQKGAGATARPLAQHLGQHLRRPPAERAVSLAFVLAFWEDLKAQGAHSWVRSPFSSLPHPLCAHKHCPSVTHSCLIASHFASGAKRGGQRVVACSADGRERVSTSRAPARVGHWRDARGAPHRSARGGTKAQWRAAHREVQRDPH